MQQQREGSYNNSRMKMSQQSLMHEVLASDVGRRFPVENIFEFTATQSTALFIVNSLFFLSLTEECTDSSVEGRRAF